MAKVVLFISAILIFGLNFGCGAASSAENSDVAAGATPAPRRAPVNNSNAAAPQVNTTMPSNGSNMAPAVNAAPGIDSKNAMRTLKPGEKIPGIPDAATLKKQMSTPVNQSQLPPEFRRALNSNSNQQVNPNANVNANAPMMMKRKPTSKP